MDVTQRDIAFAIFEHKAALVSPGEDAPSMGDVTPIVSAAICRGAGGGVETVAHVAMVDREAGVAELVGREDVISVWHRVVPTDHELHPAGLCNKRTGDMSVSAYETRVHNKHPTPSGPYPARGGARIFERGGGGPD